MITPQDVLQYWKAEPFCHFRLHMASGKTYDVKHLEMIRVGRNFLIIFTFVADEPELLDRWDTVSLMFIEHISQLELPTNQN